MLAFVAVFSFAVMMLWNWLLPSVAGLSQITFLQALGLLALARILFGGLGGAGRVFAGRAMRGGDRGHINPFRERWGKMSDDERKEFIRKQRSCYSHIFDGFGLNEDEPAPNKDRE
jgi:hypothetical protein